jgi:class 3 adenylate cyclase
VEEVPHTQFAVLGDDRIAYQVFGQGPPDLVWTALAGDCIDSRWEYPPYASFLRRLASFCRVIMFDRRGTGASDPVPPEVLPTWERWADETRSVMDAVGSPRAVLFGPADAGPASLLFAATHPNRTTALVLPNTWARLAWDDDYAFGTKEADQARLVQWMYSLWGVDSSERGRFRFPGEAVDDPEYLRWVAKAERMACSPREMVAYLNEMFQIDARKVLPTIRVPTLVTSRKGSVLLEHAKYLAEHIEGARFALVEGQGSLVYTEPNVEILAHLEKFLTGAEPSPDADRALTTLLFTDIVGSTQQAALLGDVRWRTLLDSHDSVTKALVDRHRGRVVKLTGDGALATFDGPGRALRCAFSLRDALEPVGIAIRAGVHTGEVELRGRDIGGIGVHVAARVLDTAGPGEVMVSGAVPLLVAGSGIEFEDRGEHELKGVPGSWKLFAVSG